MSEQRRGEAVSVIMHGLERAAGPERCCPQGQCAYSPSKVAHYLSVIRHLREFGQDVGEAADGALASKSDTGGRAAPSGSGLAHSAVRVWDIQQAQAALGGRSSAEAIGRWLCPFAMEGVETLPTQPSERDSEERCATNCLST